MRIINLRRVHVDESPQQGEQVMSDKFQMTVGQAHELDMAFDRNGWSAADVKELSEGNILTSVRNVLLGYSEIRPVERAVNCDADPFMPSEIGRASCRERV